MVLGKQPPHHEVEVDAATSESQNGFDDHLGLLTREGLFLPLGRHQNQVKPFLYSAVLREKENHEMISESPQWI